MQINFHSCTYFNNLMTKETTGLKEFLEPMEKQLEKCKGMDILNNKKI